MLLVALSETGEERLAHVGFAVAVGVFGIKDLRRSADDHAVAPWHDASRKIHSFQKDSRFVVAAIAISIFQKPHDSPSPAFAVHSQRVIAHLDHPQFAISAPLEGDRVQDHRLAGDQFHFEASRGLEASE